MRSSLPLVVCVCLATIRAQAEVTIFTNKTSWQNVSGPYHTITFAELPEATLVTDQYAPLGVQFTDGLDFTYHSSSFITDQAGLNGAFDETTLQFDTSMTVLALEFPGDIKLNLFSAGKLIFASPLLGGGGLGHFIGITSSVSFDRVDITDPLGGLFIDNLYFGPPVPTPGTLVFLPYLILCGRRRR